MNAIENMIAMNRRSIQTPSLDKVKELISYVVRGDKESLDLLELYYTRCKLPRTVEEESALSLINDFIGKGKYGKHIDL